MRGLINARQVSHSWTYNFKAKSGLTSRRLHQTHDSAEVTEKEAKFIRRQVQRKVWWFCNHDNIKPEHIVNLDETTVALSPAPQNGWYMKGQPVPSVPLQLKGSLHAHQQQAQTSWCANHCGREH
eukprot:620913-Amphidinium_carterae.1